jgi:protein O-GlcNAc transferase
MNEEKSDFFLNRKKGLAAFASSDYVQANKYFLLALADAPRNTELWVFSAVTLYKQLRLQQAKSCLEFALEIDPDDPKANNLYAGILTQLGEHERAINFAERAIELRPHDSGTWKNRAFAFAGATNDRKKIKDVYEEWGKKFSDPIFDNAKSPEVKNKNLHKKLSIGYISGDLRSHSVAFFIAPYLKNHNKEKFKIYVYATLFEDEISNDLKQYVDCWANAQSLSDTDLFKKIRNDDIDILVDLSGHTAGNRLDIFSMRAAPIQVTWLGFMYTLGMRAIDYRITDFGMDPIGSDEFYIENLWRLNCMATYVPPVIYPLNLTSPCDVNGYVTMVSLNHTRKISDELLKIWLDILYDNPNSGLLFIAHEASIEEASANLLPRLQSLNFPINRVSISPKLPLDEFMQISKIADFALDSFPVSGGTTTMHSLWMGLPVLALDGECAASSSSAKTLFGVGLGECVASDANQYKNIASKWISDLSSLKKLRLTTRGALQDSPLMDYRSRVEELELAYQEMWIKYINKI